MIEHERALSSSLLSVHRHADTHRGSSLSSIHMSMFMWAFLLALLSLFHFPHFLPHSFHFLWHLKFVDYNLLLTPHEEVMDLSDDLFSPQVMNPTPTASRRLQSSPARSSWTRRRSSPTQSLLRTPTAMTLHSRICFTKHTEHMPITLYEKTCLSVCRRRQCPIERGDPLSTETRKDRFGLCSTDKKRKFLQSAKQD